MQHDPLRFESIGTPADGTARRTRARRPYARRCGLVPVEPVLSAESAASVRDAARAVVRDGVRYLPVVDDGTLVGIVAVECLRQAGSRPPTATR